jgi:hypothetical protein
MKLKRTLRERKFIKAYIENSGNATEAYLVINPKTERERAREYGYRMLQKVDISVTELMELMGTTDAYLNQKLNEGLEATKVVSVIPTRPKEAQPNCPDLPDANSKSLEFVDVEDYPTRHKYLDMAYKLKNKYPAEKHELTGAGGGPIIYEEHFPALKPEKENET